MLYPLEAKEVKVLLDEIPTTGHSPLKVMAEDNKTYFLKNYEGKLPAYYLASEIIYYFLLTFWEIPTPTLVLMSLNAASFKEVLLKFSNRHKLSYYDIPAVGSLALASPVIEMNSLTEPAVDLDELLLIQNQSDIWKIGLFDIWVENDDRKPTNPNLLIQRISNEKLKIYALDHAFNFGSLKYTDLNPSFGVSQGFNDNILFTSFAKDLFKSKAGNEDFKAEVRQFFNQKVSESESLFASILDYIPDEFALSKNDKLSTRKFLFDKDRNQAVLDCFFEHIQNYA